MYVLLPLVLLVWGMVGYSLMAGKGKRAPVITPVNTLIKETGPSNAETFSIVADYRDPFLGKMPSRKPKVKKKRVSKPKAPPPPPVNWSFISYQGMVQNQKSGDTRAILTINSSGQLMKTGDVQHEVELLKIHKDSVEVRFQRTNKYIKKHPITGCLKQVKLLYTHSTCIALDGLDVLVS